MIAPAASCEPQVVLTKSILAQKRTSGSWTDPHYSRDIFVEVKVTMLISIREFWHQYRSASDRDRLPALRALIRLKITSYRFLDACGLHTT